MGVRTGSGAHLMGVRDSYPSGKVVGASSWPLSSAAEVEIYVADMSLWHGAQSVKHKDNFTFVYFLSPASLNAMVFYPLQSGYFLCISFNIHCIEWQVKQIYI
jgi:hypothetical protein